MLKQNILLLKQERGKKQRDQTDSSKGAWEGSGVGGQKRILLPRLTEDPWTAIVNSMWGAKVRGGGNALVGGALGRGHILKKNSLSDGQIHRQDHPGRRGKGEKKRGRTRALCEKEERRSEKRKANTIIN